LPATAGWQARLSRSRAELGEVTAALIPDPQIRSVMHGITLGLRQDVDGRLWDVFRRTGTAHLMAISGLHVGLVGLLGWGVGLGLSLLTRRTGPQLPVAGSLVCATVYALLGGWTLPTQRATLMAALTLLLLLRMRRACRPEVLAIAAILVLGFWPAGIFTGGFWLSFLAIICLLLTATRNRQAGRLAASIYPQVGLFVGLAIPTTLLFGGLSLVALPANFVSIPVFGLIVLPAALVATALAPFVPAAAGELLTFAGFILSALLELLAWLATIPWAWLEVSPRVVTIAVAATVLLLHVTPRIRIPVFVAAAVLSVIDLRPADRLRVTVVDVGQGLAVLVRTRNHALLYDAGAAWPGGDAGRLVIVPLLQYYGVGHLDALVVSHADNDHRGGVISVSQAVPVRVRYVPLADEPDATEQLCRDGVRWQWDGVVFEFLHPRQPAGWSENNASCVLRMTYGNNVVLLPGDIEAAAERVLLSRYPDLAADLLLAPHHGSATSSTPAFVTAVRPAYVVYTTGYRNRWGFPSAAVVDRFTAVDACGLDTAATGALEFVADGEGDLSREPSAARSMLRPWFLRAARRPPCGGL
jgi:competence protein ComEC